jgi:GNAT superfamily N-acetyltransferase
LAQVEIVEVDGRNDFREFVELPYRLYRNYPHWVPPLRIAVKEILDRNRHPFYRNAEAGFYLARRDGRAVGRIAAILDRNHNRFQEEDAGFFGFFECEQDQDAASALLDAAARWVSARGASCLRGPVNPSTNYECGMLLDAFDQAPMIMMSYNPPYYPELMDNAGMRKAKDLYAYLSTPSTVDGKKVQRVAERALAASGASVRPIDMKRFEVELERLWSVYNGAWRRNWGFVPMTREEFAAMGKEMKQILVPDFVLVGEVEGRVVGFALALPDINQALKPAGGRLFPLGLLKILYHQRTVRNLRVLALGVVEEYRATGLAAAFYASLIGSSRRLGYRDCEMSWILEDNVLMNRSLEMMGAKRYKTYRIYERN